jgi:hypothetical protein
MGVGTEVGECGCPGFLIGQNIVANTLQVVVRVPEAGMSKITWVPFEVRIDVVHIGDSYHWKRSIYTRNIIDTCI